MRREGVSQRKAWLPSVDRVLRSDSARELIKQFGRSAVTRKVREALDGLRERARAEHQVEADETRILAIASDLLMRDAAPSLRRVLNLTGTVLHTNLGRAILPEEALEAVVDVARGASNLEYDIDDGRRGNRDNHLEGRLLSLTGAEAVTVVNNNAAAVMLVLNTLAIGREVPVSRGELVEIGGSFRIPEIMSRSGCKLVEVGTTNRTHLRDFERAMCAETALVMKVHTSNYVVEGFTAAVQERELAALCRACNRPFVVDLGAGSLVDLERFGLPHEPTPMEALTAGADLVTFSADKLLGGPQAGVIVGRSKLIDQLRANPMKRALRCDKMTIAALEAVLRIYSDPDSLEDRLPTLHMLTRSLDDIEGTTREVTGRLAHQLDGIADVSIVDCESVIGSGALPTRTIPSRGISIEPRDGCGRGCSVNRIAEAFAKLPVPVVGRIHAGAFVLDLRCLVHARELTSQIENLRVNVN